MNYKILVTEPINQKGIDLLTSHGYDLCIGTGIDEDTVLTEAKDCHAILTRNASITKRIMLACPKLRVISMHGVGVDKIDVNAATALGIQVTNAARSNQSSVAEFTIGLLFDVAKRISFYNQGLKQGNWGIRSNFGLDLAGKTLGIIGMGRIGSQVANKASLGLNMNVLAYKRDCSNVHSGNGITYTNDLNEVFGRADFISIHLPYTPSTLHMIGKTQLTKMKATAFLINTGRGEVIDEAALIDVLSTHKIAGAAIDVFDGGVPDAQNPLLHMEQVIVTPHVAAFTKEALERMAVQAATGIVETLEEYPITYPVNHPDVKEGIAI